jgi:hypothetical protein
MAVTIKSAVFCVVTPRISERTRRFGATYRLHLQGRRVNQARNKSRLNLLFSCLAYYLTLKMEAICSSEASRFLRTTRRYNREDHTFRVSSCS